MAVVGTGTQSHMTNVSFAPFYSAKTDVTFLQHIRITKGVEEDCSNWH